MVTPLDLIRLAPLMDRTSGRPEVIIGIIDGPVVMNHPELATSPIREISGNSTDCTDTDSVACLHGTFIAGMLSAKRGSFAPLSAPAALC